MLLVLSTPFQVFFFENYPKTPVPICSIKVWLRCSRSRIDPATPHTPTPTLATMADDDDDRRFERHGMRLSTHGHWYKDISLNESFSGKMSFKELRGDDTAEARHVQRDKNKVSHADVRIGDAYEARKERAHTEELERVAKNRDLASALMCDDTAWILQQADHRAFERIALLEEQAAGAVAEVNKTAQVRQKKQARGSSRAFPKPIRDHPLSDDQQQGSREILSLEAASMSTMALKSAPRAGLNPQSLHKKTSYSAWAHDTFALTPRSWGVVGKGMKDHPNIDIAQSRLTKGRQTASMRKRGASREGIFAPRGEREKTIAQEKAMLESCGSVTSLRPRSVTSARSATVNKVLQHETQVEREKGPRDSLQGSMTPDANSLVQDAASYLERESDLSEAITSVATVSGADADASETATSAASFSDSWWDDVIHWVEDRLSDCRCMCDSLRVSA